jgi:hypothetical protein
MTGDQETTLMYLIVVCMGKECLCDIYANYGKDQCLRCATLQKTAAYFPAHYEQMNEALINKGLNREF